MLFLILINLTFACEYESTYANITDINSLIPINHIIQQLSKTQTLQDTLELTNITIYTHHINHSYTNIGQITIYLKQAISYAFTNNTFQSIGQAILQDVQFNMKLSFNTQTNTFESNSIQYNSPTQFSFIGLYNYYQYYQSLVSLLVAQIPPQLNQLFNAIQFQFQPIFPDYTYTYKNMNGQSLEIDFTYQSNNIQNQNYQITLAGQLIIKNYNNNICVQTQLPINSNQYQQLELFSTSIIQSIIQYSYNQNYFNIELNNNWKSADFQFLIGSFQNILYNLEKVNPITPVTGWCNLTKIPVYNPLNITLNYECNFYFSEDNIKLLTLNLAVVLNLNFYQVLSQIEVVCTSYRFQLDDVIQSFNEKYPPKSQFLSLANLYIKTILNAHVKDHPLFGSGFQTIPRQSPNITINNDYLMIYQKK
ncbi:unnamed protein product (macronuclear) [Paramecium tetraurelia]|uniref:Lipid-binding serum glycoprotein C-terminal domain-containing protein n=1 Tax=Paramecium tetraurelia TaxID=5888 RepID=A0DVT8_PARTE|nr:uncharacterized protein GSPATT00020808001 [Paramecium tetraurelia]CAK87155.1 unnamed protein product [Paramecium tetraurelia]|eukprot:XP_001454552.1 hypothetical protein (macronuclear) [Paramecium tetraurelia strain d4-2]